MNKIFKLFILLLCLLPLCVHAETGLKYELKTDKEDCVIAENINMLSVEDVLKEQITSLRTRFDIDGFLATFSILTLAFGVYLVFVTVCSRRVNEE